MSHTSPLKYFYGMNAKISSSPEKTALNKIFPHIEDLTLKSREFDAFEDAITSAKGLVHDLTEHLNESVGQALYKNVIELNPRFSGHPTLSKEWGPYEIAKLWIVPSVVDLENPKGGISALALAQLMEVPGEQVLVS